MTAATAMATTTTTVTSTTGAPVAASRRGAIAAITAVVGGGRAAGDGEGGGAGLSSTKVDVVLSKIHTGVRGLERRKGHRVAEDGADRFEAAVESMEELHGEIIIGYLVASVGETVGKGLEAPGVVGDGKVALLEVPVLAHEMEVLRPWLGKEVVADALPGGEGIDSAAHDQLKEGVCQGEEHPENEALVDG